MCAAAAADSLLGSRAAPDHSFASAAVDHDRTGVPLQACSEARHPHS